MNTMVFLYTVNQLSVTNKRLLFSTVNRPDTYELLCYILLYDYLSGLFKLL